MNIINIYIFTAEVQQIKLGRCFSQRTAERLGMFNWSSESFLVGNFLHNFLGLFNPSIEKKSTLLFQGTSCLSSTPLLNFEVCFTNYDLVSPSLLEFFGFWVGGTKIGKRIWIPPHPPLTCKIPNVTLIELHQFGLCFYCKQRLEKRPETLNLTNEVSHMKPKQNMH